MCQPVGFLDLLDPETWSGRVDRPDLQGPWTCGWDGAAEKDQNRTSVHLVRSGASDNTAFGVLDMTSVNDGYVSAWRAAVHGVLQT